MLENKKLYIFDMDGTVYLGDKVFEDAVEFICNLRATGKRVLFFTNNASHNAAYYFPKLERMGFMPKSDELMTAGDVTAEFLLRHRRGKRVYLVGTDELRDDYLKRGIEMSENADIVVSSFDTSLTYKKLEIACALIRNGAEYICTHPDLNCPTEEGFIPDSGAIAAMITVSTGVSPKFFGKPGAETIDMICEYTGCKKTEMVVFGDRLYTDIALGKKNGVTSVLMLTGETKAEDLVSIRDSERPDYVFKNMRDVQKSIDM